MRFPACLLVAFVCSVADASQPGQPFDCSDWVFVAPGLSCSVLLPPPLPANTIDAAWWARGNNFVIDNEGYMLIVREDSVAGRIEIRRRNALGEQFLAYVINGRDAGTWRDVLSLNSACGDLGTCWGSNPRIGEGFSFDAINGRLLLPLTNSCPPGCPSDYVGGHWVAAIDGFTKLFDVMQSYQPSTSALGFRVPVRPEGMAGADHFDTFWGPLAKPLDFTQARPLACGYPATAPHVADYLSVADTVPTPAPGQGVYYVTSATYQGATRYGRKTTAGHLTGRDPALLPACTP
jgi:hypothetical protein